MDWQILAYILPVAAGSVTALVYISGKAEERVHVKDRGRGSVYIVGATNLFKLIILPLTLLSPLFLLFKDFFATGNLAIIKLLAVFLLNSAIYVIVTVGIGGIPYITSDIEIEGISEKVYSNILNTNIRYVLILAINYNLFQSIYLLFNLISSSQHYIISIILFSGTLTTYILTIIILSTLYGVFYRNPTNVTVYTNQGKDEGVLLKKTDKEVSLGHTEDDRNVTAYNRDIIEKIEYPNNE